MNKLDIRDAGKNQFFLSLQIFGKRQVLSYCLFGFFFEKLKNNYYISEEIDFFSKNGFVKTKNNFFEEVKKIKKVLKTKKRRNEVVEDYIIDLEDKNYISSILVNKLSNLINDLNNYYDSKVVIVDVHAWKNYSYKKKKIKKNNFDFMAESFHQDGYLPNYIKIHINLQDVREDMGPLKVVKKKFSKQFIKEYRYQNRFIYNQNENLKSHYIYSNEGKIGDALLFDSTNCFHRASVPTNGETREMLQLTLLVLPKKNKQTSFFSPNQVVNYSNIYRNMTKPPSRVQTLRLLLNYMSLLKN